MFRLKTACLAIAFLALFLGLSLSGDFTINGEVRQRIRFVDSSTRGPLKSTYGEEIVRGWSLRHRLIFEIAFRLGENVTVGGLLRASNEPEEVLREGPEYYSSPFGSAFIEYRSKTTFARMGYYHQSYSPLTLMRWDLNDDAEGGGCPVCPSTPGVAGIIHGESLEELGPDLTFEGLSFQTELGHGFSVDGFLARPKTASIQRGEYQIISFGGRASFSRYMHHASSFLNLSLIALRSQEDEKSLEPSQPTQPFKNTVAGVVLDAPVTRWLSGNLEWTLSTSYDTQLTDQERKRHKGTGGIAGITIGTKPITLRISYIHLSPHWQSYFKGLSYNSDRKGWRVRLTFESDRLLISAFVRYLRTINREAKGGTSRTVYPTYSGRINFRLTPSLTVGLGGVYTTSGISSGLLSYEKLTSRTSVVGTISFDLAKNSTLTFEERFVRNRDLRPEFNLDYDVTLSSIYVKVHLW